MRLERHQQHLLLLSICLSALGYLIFALWSGASAVWVAIQRVGLPLILISLLLSLLNYLLRAQRWSLYLQAYGHRLPFRLNTRIYFAGFALTTTPGKAGEMIRSVFLAPWGVRYRESTALFFSERLADLAAILLLAITGLGQFHYGENLYFATMLAILTGLLILRTAWPERLLRRLGKWRPQPFATLADIASNTRQLWQGRLLWLAGALSILAWLAEGVACYFILHALNTDIPLSTALFIYGAAMLAGAISFLPGGLGGTEAIMVSLLTYNGLPLQEATAATLIIRLVTLWFAVALGLFAITGMTTTLSEK